jgi:hypothetical protein
MSLFGFLLGFFIVCVIYMSKQSRHFNFEYDLALRRLNTKSCMTHASDDFIKQPYWTTDDQFLWPYWVWNQRGFLMPGPFYPYYNDPGLLYYKTRNDLLRQEIKKDILNELGYNI